MRTLLLTAMTLTAAPTYQHVQTIHGPDGGWDYASFDPVSHHVYVARSDAIMMLDTTTGAVSRLAPASRAHEVLPLPGGTLVLETDGASNTVRLIDVTTGMVLAALPSGRNPDGAVYDPASSTAYVMNGASGDVTVVDPPSRTAVATIPVGGKLEFPAVDGAGRLFVNVEDRGEIAVIDTRARTLVGRYKLDGCEEPTGLAYAPERKLLITACDNGVAKAVDPKTGAIVATLAIGQGPDAVLYDPGRHRALIPCGGDGVLAVIPLDGTAPLHVAALVPTAHGARTGAVDPASGKVYLPVAELRPGASPDARPVPVPGSFAVQVFAP